jgi:Zn-dependent protease
MFGITKDEAWELLKSTLIVGLVFTIAAKPPMDPQYISLVFAVSLAAAGAGFFIHELAHKFVAQRMGYWAQYRGGQFPYMSVLFAFAGWILLSPGAVEITGGYRPLTKKASGIISLAGPATNMLLSIMFFGLSLVPDPIIRAVGSFGYSINIWLAVFNTLPVPGFDGAKIKAWNKIAYVLFGLAAAVLFFAL